MCGIVVKRNFDGTPVNEAIFDQYFAQRARGIEGFGLFDGEYLNMVKSVTEEKILKWLSKYDSDFIMFHHRFPTSTANVKRAAHPISTKDYFGDTQYIMVHNGMIRNDDKLFEKHAELGIPYSTWLDDLSFNDSECLLWELALTLEGKQPKVETRGYLAFVMLKLVKGELTTMYFGRDGAPLHLFRDNGTIELSSEGRGDNIDEDKLYSYNVKLNRLTDKKMLFTEYVAIPAYTGELYNGRSYGSTYDDVCSQGRTLGDYDQNRDLHWSSAENKWLSREEMIYRGYATPLDIEEEYEQNEAGFWIPARENSYPDAAYLGNDDEEYDDDEYAELQRQHAPTIQEVEDFVLDELCKHQGNLDQTYNALEAEYNDVYQDHLITRECIEELFMLERALAWVENDPEYKSASSISSKWEAIWADNPIMTS